MSTETLAVTDRPAPTCPPAARKMTPVAINGLLGWIHTPENHSQKDVAAIICPALERDALDSYHAMRALADNLADAGFVTLRFAYAGTGDSVDISDNDEYPNDHWLAWQKSVNDAADWMKANTAAQRFVFIGLRIGAMIAASAIEHRNDVAGLALLAPVLRGRSYLRQIWIQATLQSKFVPPLADGLSFEEFNLSAETVERINQIDLRKIDASSFPQVAFFSQASSAVETECGTVWETQGATIAHLSFDAMAPMLHHDPDAESQAVDLSAILKWVTATISSEISTQSLATNFAVPKIYTDTYQEAIVMFGDQTELAGVFCRPAGADRKIVVIFGNTGRDPRFASARFGTDLARQLASTGISSLRMDFPSYGDSIGATGRDYLLSHILEIDRTENFKSAIDYVKQHQDYDIVLLGNCSGAYHAFHAGLADGRVSKLLLVNMPAFKWQVGESVLIVRSKELPISYYFKRLFYPRIWKRVFRNDIDFKLIFVARIQKLLKRKTNAIEGRYCDDSTENKVKTFLKNGNQILFVYLPENVGAKILEDNLGPNADRLKAPESVSVEFVSKQDNERGYRHAIHHVADLLVSNLAKVP